MADSLPERTERLPEWRVYAVVLGLISALYAVVFVVTGSTESIDDILLWSLSNALPHVMCAIPLVDRIAPRLPAMKLSLAIATAGVAIIAYALVAYAATVFLLALTARVETDDVVVRFFSGPALPWQVFQGIAYGSIAIFAGLWRTALIALGNVLPGEPARPQRWLVKTVEGIVPVDPDEIVRIEAVGEYSQLVLSNRKTLSRIGMGECVNRLRGLPFLRVHRSHLVHSDAIVNAEPAGNGRLQLTLRNGDHVVTSRDGARLVRATSV